MNERLEVDVAVVGGSLAGCTAATLFARAGHSVVVLEASADPSCFKKVCTHFIQPCASATISRLGLDDALLSAGAIRNRLEVWTEWGWIRSEGDGARGWNVRRQTLDPLLRGLTRDTPGVTFLAGHAVRRLAWRGNRVAGVEVDSGSGRTLRISARLTVAADGRGSRVAELARIPASERANNRFTYFTYFENLRLSHGANAQYWHLNANLAYAFVNDRGHTLLGCFLPSDRLSEFKSDPEREFLRFWEQVPEGPALRRARRQCEFRGMLRLPNASRSGAARGLAFIGDAALCLDPIWGTGCGWAFESAAWLVDHVAATVRGSPQELDAALVSYARAHRRRTREHAWHIADFSRVRPSRWLEELVFSAATRDERVAERLHAYLARQLSLRELVRVQFLARCLWVNGRSSGQARSAALAASEGQP